MSKPGKKKKGPQKKVPMDPHSEPPDNSPTTDESTRKKKRTTSPETTQSPDDMLKPDLSNEDITSTKKARRASLESTPDSHTPNDSSHPDCHPLQEEETSEDMEASADPTSRPLQAPDQPSTSKFRITSSRDFDTAVDSLFAIEKEFPFIDATTSITKDGDFILSANTESTKDLLNSLRTLSSGKVVNILPHTTPPRTFKSIVERFPIGFPLQRLTDLPFVISATRCVSRTTKEETRQVLLITNDTPPSEINLGIFGKFQTRAYIPEPLRCFKCQRFGHHQAKCRASPRCAICAQPHATEGCLSKLKAGEKNRGQMPELWRQPLCVEPQM